MKTNLPYSRNLTREFDKKVTAEFYNPDETLANTKDCLSDTTGIISQFIGSNVRKSPGNINWEHFHWGKLNYIICR